MPRIVIDIGGVKSNKDESIHMILHVEGAKAPEECTSLHERIVMQMTMQARDMCLAALDVIGALQKAMGATTQDLCVDPEEGRKTVDKLNVVEKEFLSLDDIINADKPEGDTPS